MNQTSPMSAFLPPSSVARQSFPAVVEHAVLSGLVGTDLSRRFCYWRGLSGRRHLFSVFPLDPRRPADWCPSFEQAVFLAVRHGGRAEREILAFGESGQHSEGGIDGPALLRAIAAGANEIHVHLLAQTVTARRAILCDLRP